MIYFNGFLKMSLDDVTTDEIQKLMEKISSKEEKAQYASEALVVYDDDEKHKPKVHHLLTTECCFYQFDKDKGLEADPISTDSLFELTEIQIKNEDFIIKFKTTQYHLSLNEPFKLMVNIYTNHKALYWGVHSNQIPRSSSSLLQNNFYQAADMPLQRPENLLLIRYVGLCVAKHLSPEPEIIQIFKDYQENPRRILHLSNFDLQTVTPTMFSLLLEGNLRSITLDNFGVHNFGAVLNWILTNQSKLISVDLKNYETANFKGISNKRSSFNNVSTIRIHDCTTQFILDFFTAMKSVYYKIDTLIFENIRFDETTTELIVTSFQTYNFFSSITSLAFISCTCNNISFNEFASQIIQSLEKLSNIHIENCSVDVCDMLTVIAQTDSSVQNICLRKNFASSVISHEQHVIPQSILSLDFGNCDFNTDSLISLISGICHRTRRLPLALAINAITIDTTWVDVFERLSSESLLPVLTELNISNNEFDKNAFKAFLKFLETQSPITSKSQQILQHLNISKCIPEKNTKSSMDMLLDFLSSRKLWGLEACGIKPDIRYKDIPCLYSLNIGDNKMDDETKSIIFDIIQQAPSLAELGVDSLEFSDVKEAVEFYNNVLGYPKIISFDQPKKLIDENIRYNEVKRMKESFNKKRQFSTVNQRLSLYLALASEFSIRVPQPISFVDFDESTKEGSNVSFLLSESKFNNPIPSLFTLANMNNVDVSVDPIAAMVSEYVSTSGRFGTIPPTAPPVEQAKDKFTLPSIFASMETKNEMEMYSVDIGFDVNSKEVLELSEQLSDALEKEVNVNIKGDTKFWGKRANFVAFETMDLP
ncbi:hypothetical protein GPJ56_009198 [Histomonas meleagridis]|uniref:uncharacterized protein n=1 Tax=Histomonas meleagridis TaxID=135588 RepID=UPI00355A083B|nr:hypothetical protein GPJ56_009198 [Histomonas meleagridis]KAH0801570.1 hypothetical protein GO595_005569 [Histomonas meleagridis]